MNKILERRKCKDMIIKQIQNEINPPKEKMEVIETTLNRAKLDDLERLYDAFERFGVQSIIDNI